MKNYIYCFYAINNKSVDNELSNVEKQLLEKICHNKGFIAVSEERFSDLAELALESLVSKGYITFLACADALLKVKEL